ncbi:MAG: flagellar motor switch protein FliM [Chlamydiales bacterium]
MSPSLDEAETDAIREIAGDVAQAQAAEVSLRDFQRPRRLSAERVRSISKKIVSKFQEICANMRPLLRETTKMNLCAVTEVNAAEVFDGLSAPFLLRCFRCEGELGWLVWDSGYAAAAAEAILTGMFEGEVTERELSSAELCIIAQLLDEVTAPIARAFDLTLEPVMMVQSASDLAEVSPSTDRVEPRLAIHMQFEGIGGTSDLRLYLSGFSPEDGDETDPDSLPEHLNKVSIGMQAYLASIDIPLTDLLGLELGDVIPLGMSEGAPLQLYVEDRVCATAEMGRIGNTLAVRITELDPRSGEVDQPSEN